MRNNSDINRKIPVSDNRIFFKMFLITIKPNLNTLDDKTLVILKITTKSQNIFSQSLFNAPLLYACFN